jgi:hypothetical protein
MLNQLQRLVQIVGKAKSVLALFLLRLDEQGLYISSPWENSEEDSIILKPYGLCCTRPCWIKNDGPVAKKLLKKCNWNGTKANSA